MNLLSSYDYDLPLELIATEALTDRTASRMMVLDKLSWEPQHKLFTDVVDHIEPGDCLVFNNTKVFPARLIGTKETGGRAEVFLSKQIDELTWEALVSCKAKNKIGKSLYFKSEDGRHHLKATIRQQGLEPNIYLVEFDRPAEEELPFIGQIPLPPYFNREPTEVDIGRYQTVYAADQFKKAVAAPTAGLHFDEKILNNLRAKGVHIVFVTLHVGLGTFMPVRCENIDEHFMHSEEWELDQQAAETLNLALKRGGKICAVGTTSVRVLETAYNDGFSAARGVTNIFIRPGYQFKVVDRLLTNFHLPKSTLLMLVSAACALERILNAYQKAISEKYRFYSYGDCCLIEIAHKSMELP